MRRPFWIFLAGWILGWPGLAVSSRAQPGSPDGIIYKTGYSWTMRLGKDLYGALPREGKSMISPQPVSIETEMTPFMRMMYYPDEVKPIRGIWISVGFIDLVNRIAHAAAISARVKKHKDYFKNYILLLATEDGQKELQPLPDESNPAFWADDVLNEQQANFNSIVGILVGVKMAHHYLGHYDKYKARLEDDKEAQNPINLAVTPEEWHEAFQKGVKNAYDAGCMMEGAAAFYEAFDKMPKRPCWAIYFLPETCKVSKMVSEMKKMQEKFLNGK